MLVEVIRQLVACWSWFSPTIWAPGIKLKLSNVVASSLVYRAIFLALFIYILRQGLNDKAQSGLKLVAVLLPQPASAVLIGTCTCLLVYLGGWELCTHEVSILFFESESPTGNHLYASASRVLELEGGAL